MDQFQKASTHDKLEDWLNICYQRDFLPVLMLAVTNSHELIILGHHALSRDEVIVRLMDYLEMLRSDQFETNFVLP